MQAGGTLKVSGIATVRSEKWTQGTSSPVSFGNIVISADRVEVLGGGQISANSFIGKGGDLTVDAREIVLDGAEVIPRGLQDSRHRATSIRVLRIRLPELARVAH